MKNRSKLTFILFGILILSLPLASFAQTEISPRVHHLSSLSTAIPHRAADPAATPQAVPTSITLQTTTGTLGTYLTDGDGKSLYIFEADTANTSTCLDNCAQVWPPLIAPSGVTAQAGTGATDNLIGTLTRADGTLQVTYNQKPLYYYVGDTTAGQTTGQGISSFNALWYLLQADGTPLTGQAAGTAGTSTNSSGGTGSYYAATWNGTAGCTVYTDAYGNVTGYEGCSSITPVYSNGTNCVVYTDAYGNIVGTSNCGNSVSGSAGAWYRSPV